jgi:hypothetical protein
MEACYGYGGTGVMERSCAVARGIDINTDISCHVINNTIPKPKAEAAAPCRAVARF